MIMEYQIADHRIFCEDAAGKLLAEITFPDADAHTACIDHTFVDDSLRGQGVAGELMRRAVALLTEQGKQVTATCSYAASEITKSTVQHGSVPHCTVLLFWFD